MILLLFVAALQEELKHGITAHLQTLGIVKWQLALQIKTFAFLASRLVTDEKQLQQIHDAANGIPVTGRHQLQLPRYNSCESS